MFHTRRGRALAGLSSLALVAGLGACSAHPGVALKVGDTSYSEADITTSIDQFDAMFGQKVGRSEFVSYLTGAVPIEQMGADHGIVVDDATVEAQIEAAKEQQAITEVPDNLNHAMMDILRMQMTIPKLQDAVTDTSQLTQELAQKQAEADVRINPRYGQVSADNQIVPSTFGDVVVSKSAMGSDPAQSGN